jgi:hypothetical protein
MQLSYWALAGRQAVPYRLWHQATLSIILLKQDFSFGEGDRKEPGT